MKINILGLDYEVIAKNNPIINNEVVNGYISYQKNEIVINENIPKQRQNVTTLHEIIHGILDALGLNVNSENENLV